MFKNYKNKAKILKAEWLFSVATKYKCAKLAENSSPRFMLKHGHGPKH